VLTEKHMKKKPLLPPCLVCGRRTADSLGIHDACVLPGFRRAIALWFFFHVLTAYKKAPWTAVRLEGRAGSTSNHTLGLAGGAGGRGRKVK